MFIEKIGNLFPRLICIKHFGEKYYKLSQNSSARRSPRKRLYQADQYDSFISMDSCLNRRFPPNGYTFTKSDSHVLFYKLEENEISISQVTDRIRIDSELRFQCFWEPVPLSQWCPLSQWFRHERDCRLSRKSVLETSPACLH